jgi:hypothetical protein
MSMYAYGEMDLDVHFDEVNFHCTPLSINPINSTRESHHRMEDVDMHCEKFEFVYPEYGDEIKFEIQASPQADENNWQFFGVQSEALNLYDFQNHFWNEASYDPLKSQNPLLPQSDDNMDISGDVYERPVEQHDFKIEDTFGNEGTYESAIALPEGGDIHCLEISRVPYEAQIEALKLPKHRGNRNNVPAEMVHEYCERSKSYLSLDEERMDVCQDSAADQYESFRVGLPVGKRANVQRKFYKSLQRQYPNVDHQNLIRLVSVCGTNGLTPEAVKNYCALLEYTKQTHNQDERRELLAQYWNVAAIAQSDPQMIMFPALR